MAEVASQPSMQSNSLAAAHEVQDYLKARLSSSNATTHGTSSSAAKHSIPIIDLTPSFSHALAARQSVAAQMADACTTTGFFYITGHSIPAATCAGTLKLAERFFHELSPAAKEAIHMKHSSHFRGYEPASWTSVNEHEVKETKEGFNWGYESGLDPTGGDGKYVELDGSTDGSKNLWPAETDLPGFYTGIAEYYGHVLQLSRHLFRLFALSLSLPEDYFESLTTHPGGIARLINYPASKNPTPLPVDEEEIGLGAHTDYECFTLLLQDSTPGLEILSPEGQWISATPVEGGIVVNVADFLMRWTNGKYKSTVHRVVNRTAKQRYSVPFFFSINYDATVETLPGCLADGEVSKYPPITAGRYVLDRLGMTVKTGKY
ncbi:2og-fe oxygenase superfamily protein [Phlyctema vagabunda]|uniref:2og-fe oxygenase superfamily protein n=1 Tax=Phlyctema vagabunda TaxID=108571 RepID=A0ABR4PH80_9HELO